MRRRGGMLSILRGRPEGRTAPRRPDRRGALTLETLEGRLVLSSLGTGLPTPLAALPGGSGSGGTTGSGGTKCPTPPPPPTSGGSTSGTGGSTGQQNPPPPPPPTGLGPALTFLGIIPPGPNAPPPPPAGSNAQLAKDEAKLNADVSGFLAKSAVTKAELTALAADDQAIVAAKVKLNQAAVTTAESDLANAVAGGTYGANTAKLQAEFASLFTGSTLSQTAITKAYGDVVAILQSAHATTTYLKTVAADQAAIQLDLAPPKPKTS